MKPIIYVWNIFLFHALFMTFRNTSGSFRNLQDLKHNFDHFGRINWDISGYTGIEYPKKSLISDKISNFSIFNIIIFLVISTGYCAIELHHIGRNIEYKTRLYYTHPIVTLEQIPEFQPKKDHSGSL